MESRDIECDILILGGGLGGCAAALAALDKGYRVCLTEENHWLGGQATSQAVSALDEHRYIERFGGTTRYYQFREGIRAYYRRCYQLKNPDAPHLNPGAGWVSQLCFEPKVGLASLLGLLAPHAETDRLEIFHHAQVTSAQVTGTAIRRVDVHQSGYDRLLRFHPAYVLDATELGDLLPLLDTPYRSGAEGRDQTGEPHARDQAAPQLTQSFTVPFVVDFCQGEDHTIPKPPDYPKNHPNFTLTLQYARGERTYKMFETAGDLPGSFWGYRRILGAEQFAPGQVAGDLALINWQGNDYTGGTLIDVSPKEQAGQIEAAKNMSLGLLRWLQTEVERDDGQGHGYPELRLRTDVLGTADGFSQYPYIREARRIEALKTIVEQEVAAPYQPGARAEFFADSVGLGSYSIDIHGQATDVVYTAPTKPFQIPLGALIPKHLDNLLPACKNIGTTHLTNGCYRLHPVEWNIGEAAGELAAYCLQEKKRPAQVYADTGLRRAYQRQLLAAGVPLYWYEDVPLGHAAFQAVQQLAVDDVWTGAEGHLRFDPDAAITAQEREKVLTAAGLAADAVGRDALSRGELARRLAQI
ncbi:MAG: FAD-dependent oxidoreductase [Candidatus Latescibacteria bacterium]|nr:FAD-dependent oxidoreductase [Candidatus Latescibacterota bacterium]